MTDKAITLFRFTLSKSRGRLLSALLLCLVAILPGLTSAEQNRARKQVSDATEWTYTLKSDESFAQVARQLLVSGTPVERLASYNRIRTPSDLAAGDSFRIPVAWLQQQPEPARVRGLSGKVQIRSASGGGLRSLSEGARVRAGDTIITRDGLATIELADGSVVRINPASSVVFNRLTRYGRAGMTDTRIRLERGGVSNRVKPMMEDGARFEIETPSAVAAVRGTAFSVQADARGSHIQVTEGSVDFGHKANQRTIPAGYGASVSKDPAEPVRIRRLPPAPATLPVAGPITGLPQDLAWEPNGATAYQVDILEASSGNWIRREQTRKPQVSLANLSNGQYQVEVAALSRNGTTGMPASTTIEVDLSAHAATLVEPAAEAELDTDQPRFRWDFQGKSERARVEIAKDDAFTETVASSDWSTQASATPSTPLPPGRYYWRVVTEAGGNSVATSETRTLVLNGTLPPVRVLSANYIDRQVRIFWEDLDEASGYLLQLSEDPSFEEIIKEATVDETTAALRLIPGRRYFVRLRAVSEGPLAGRWGPGRELFVE